MRITRRHLLAATGAIGAAGALGAGGLYVRWWDRAPGEGLRCLSSDEYEFVQALAEAWMPVGGAPAISGREADCGAFFDGVLSFMPPLQAKGLKLLLQVLDDSTLVTHATAYRRLGQAEREAALHGWIHHDQHLVRSAVQALMVLMGEGYTTHPDVVVVLQPLFRCWYGR